MRNIFALFILVVFTSSVSADDRADKIKSLMEAQGLIELFEQQLEMGKAQGEQAGQQMMSQIISQLKPNEVFREEFQHAFTTFMSKLESPWGAEEIVSVWSQYYGSQFSNTELDELLKFYNSKIGQKEVKASKSAMQDFTNHFQKLGEPIMQTAVQEYIAELKQLSEKCNCAKNKNGL